MGSVKRFAAINTKIRALEGRLLTGDDYENLLDMSSLSEMINYLKSKTSYVHHLEEIDPDNAIIDHLEVVFRKILFMRIQAFIHYFVDDYRKLFKVLFMRYEVEDLKLFIRALERGEDVSILMDHMVILGVTKTLDYERLSQSRNLEDLLDALEGTPYQEIISYYMDESAKRRIFYMEMNLDRYYFKKLNEQVEKLDKSDQIPLQEILGKNTDILNLQWIYRGRKFYGLSAEELLNYTLLGGHKLSFKSLKRLCYAPSLEEALSYIKESPYGFLVKREDFEVFLELNMERYIYDEFMRLKRTSHMNIIESMVYMHQMEYEIRDLFTIFEAKRYGFDKKETRKYLVRIRPEPSPLPQSGL